MKNNCENCRYLLSQIQQNLQKSHFCTRYPPQVAGVHPQQGIISSYPPVMPAMFCGEHRMKVELPEIDPKRLLSPNPKDWSQ